MLRPDSTPTPQTYRRRFLAFPTLNAVTEWLLAIALFWRYAEVSGNPRWKGMSWAMLPALGSAMSACTW